MTVYIKTYQFWIVVVLVICVTFVCAAKGQQCVAPISACSGTRNCFDSTCANAKLAMLCAGRQTTCFEAYQSMRGVAFQWGHI
jgi:hypothetical protein